MAKSLMQVAFVGCCILQGKTHSTIHPESMGPRNPRSCLVSCIKQDKGRENITNNGEKVNREKTTKHTDNIKR